MTFEEFEEITHQEQRCRDQRWSTVTRIMDVVGFETRTGQAWAAWAASNDWKDYDEALALIDKGLDNPKNNLGDRIAAYWDLVRILGQWREPPTR